MPVNIRDLYCVLDNRRHYIGEVLCLCLVCAVTLFQFCHFLAVYFIFYFSSFCFEPFESKNIDSMHMR